MDGRDLDCMPQLVPNRQKGLNNQSGDADSHSNSGRCKHISESYMVSLPPAGETIHALLHRESQNADALVTATRTQILVPPITQLWLFWCLKFIRYVCQGRKILHILSFQWFWAFGSQEGSRLCKHGDKDGQHPHHHLLPILPHPSI